MVSFGFHMFLMSAQAPENAVWTCIAYLAGCKLVYLP
jgi:hypothetical protein